MRWNEQQVGDHGVGAAQTLPGLDGLLRTVRTPEFAGMVFHEVEARSALNRVPGSSPMPFRWTVNPYRGCAHACVYCLAGPTRVLLADGRTRPIAELRVGDVVLGTEQVDGVRRYVPTQVLAHWSTRKPAYAVRLAGGTELVTSGDHRFLTAHGWRHVSAGWCRAGRRPHLRPGSPLLGPGPFGPDRPAAQAGSHSAGYRRGYLCGLVRGDGPDFPSGALGPRSARPRPPPAGRRTARTDRRRGRARPHRTRRRRAGRHANHDAWPGRRHAPPLGTGISCAWSGCPRCRRAGGGCTGRCTRPGPAGGRSRADVVRWPEQADADWCAGFLAGVTDACGAVAAGELRVVHTDEAVVGRVAGALHRLGFAFAVGARDERSAGRAAARRRRGVARAAGPHHARGHAAVGGRTGRRRAGAGGDVAVRALGHELPMYDITTGTGDFVAEGVISHNCFARNTHTYLDIDAGADFDRQIVVKVNVARVLRRELRSPRWSGEPVAMGTNTDPYQRAEGRYRLMPGIIDAFARTGTPFSVLTKGTVLSRTCPRSPRPPADVPVSLGVSIALLDRAVHATLEPGTPTPAARLDLVRRITDAGLPCGVMVAPVLPAAHRFRRGARQPAGAGRRGGRHRGERAGAAPAARHPRVVPGLVGARAPGAGRAVRPAVPARGVRGTRSTDGRWPRGSRRCCVATASTAARSRRSAPRRRSRPNRPRRPSSSPCSEPPAHHAARDRRPVRCGAVRCGRCGAVRRSPRPGGAALMKPRRPGTAGPR